MRHLEVKPILCYLRACFLYRTGLWWVLSRGVAREQILVLTFHRVLDDSEFHESSSQPELCVRKSTFQDFLAWVNRQAEVVDLRYGLPRHDRRSAKPRVAVTFDDGWLDNHHHAVPAAVEAGVPLTIFVCPGLMNQAFPFWPERVSYLLRQTANTSLIASLFPALTNSSPTDALERIIEELKGMAPEDRTELVRRLEGTAGGLEFPSAREPLNRTMGWQHLRELRALGVEIGSHTMTHPILTCLPADRVAPELSRSRQQIEQRLDAACPLLAYPNGNHNVEIRNAAARAGYKAAFTTEPGLWTAGTDVFRIPRINVFEHKLIGPDGRFSPEMASYYLFWRAFRSAAAQKTFAEPAVAPVVGI